MVATTSSAVSVLPLWKVMPLRILKTHFLAPSEGSKLSATCGMTSFFGLICTSGAPITDLPQAKVKPFDQVAGSSESVVWPWPTAALKVPPCLGSARAARVNIAWAAASVTPEATANWMKSRRDSLPRPTAFSAAFSFISNSVMRLSP